MSALPGSLRLPRFGLAPRRRDFFSLRLAVVTVVVVSLTSALVVGATPLVRLPLAMVLAFTLTMLTLARPGAGIVVTFAYLVLLALLRRLLIAETGWWQADPLLLVAPWVGAVLLVKLFVLERRPFAPDLLSKLVAVLLVISLVQTANPAGGGLGRGLLGVLYITVPLLWFFVGREVLDARATDGLLKVAVLLGIAVGGYGLYQSQIGHPAWDDAWIHLAGYLSLNVGDVTRPFGTFSSSAEYALFIGSALVISIAMALRGRTVFLLALPVLAPALFLASARGALVMAVFAAVVLVGLSTLQPRRALAVIVIAIGLAFGAFQFFGSQFSSGAAGSTNALVSHQLGGLGNPLDPESSTLLIHATMVFEGVRWSLTHPLGQGTASTNVGGVARDETGDQYATGSTEVDLSNSFVAFGPVGGILYTAIFLLTLTLAVRCLFAGRRMMLPVIGLLVASLGQWLIGGHYALSPLTWMLIGVVAATAAQTLRRPT